LSAGEAICVSANFKPALYSALRRSVAEKHDASGLPAGGSKTLTRQEFLSAERSAKPLPDRTRNTYVKLRIGICIAPCLCAP
jgi:hypothetical protein